MAIHPPTKGIIKKAAALLRQGEIISFPTETVYGLGANALDQEAVQKIFQAKGRPADNPLIVHILDQEWLPELVAEVPPLAAKLIQKFWPGPLTILFKKSDIVPDITTAGLTTVAIRAPRHPVARELLKEAKIPLAAPSANLSGRLSPTTAAAVNQDFPDLFTIDGGPCEEGLESTVIDLTKKKPVILRPGTITPEMISNVIGPVTFAKENQKKPLSPGMKYRHYAPQTKLILSSDIENTIKKYRNKRIGLVSITKAVSLPVTKHIHLTSDLKIVAREMFKVLCELDAAALDILIVETVPEEGLGISIMNRLRKAADT